LVANLGFTRMTRRITQLVLALIVLAVAGGGAFFAYRRWQAGQMSAAASAAEQPAAPIVDGTMPARVSEQARANLGLTARPARPTIYWRKIEVPGVVVDRPGVSDCGVIAPVTGVVTEISSHPGETVEPNARLFKLRLTSESLHTSQRELFKASREIEIARQQKQRLEGLAQSGGIAAARIIEIDNSIQRLDATVQAYRQDLLARGLTEEQVNESATGQFVTEITVRAPPENALQQAELALVSRVADGESTKPPFKYEFHELAIALGQQAEAGQVLCHLSDHRTLLIEGRGFKDDMPLIQEAAKAKLPIEVEFEMGNHGKWPPAPKELLIHHIENTIDTNTRTFSFHLVLENQWQSYEHKGHSGLLWRFRPGDRVRLQVAVEKLENVIVLPQAAVVREGPEAYVFRQNGDLFDRRPVHIVAEDGTNVVIANDGSIRLGSYIAQNAAASLNRVLKAQMASGQPTNVHVHADGTVHANH
jgi:sulfur transfer complex TusBCD TusB component (DsrH family)